MVLSQFLQNVPSLVAIFQFSTQCLRSFCQETMLLLTLSGTANHLQMIIKTLDGALTKDVTIVLSTRTWVLVKSIANVEIYSASNVEKNLTDHVIA